MHAEQTQQQKHPMIDMMAMGGMIVTKLLCAAHLPVSEIKMNRTLTSPVQLREHCLDRLLVILPRLTETCRLV